MFSFGGIFTNLLAASGTLYGWLNPFFGLMVYYAFSTLRPTYLWFWAFPDGSPRHSLMVGLSTLVGWIASGLGSWKGTGVIALPLLGFALYVLSGTIAAINCQHNPPMAWEYLSYQYKIGIMAILTITLVREARQIQILAWVITICLGYLAYMFNYHFKINNWNFVYMRGFGGIDNNGTAMIMVAGVPLAFFMGVHDRRWWVKGLCFFAVVLLCHVPLFAFSRGAQLGLIMVGALIFIAAILTLPRKFLILALTAIFVAITLRLAGEEVRARFMTIFADEHERDASAASRFDTWAAAWACIKDHPLGVGPRNFNAISHLYGLGPNKSVHNLFLQTGADYGVLGMVGLAIFYLASMWQTFWLTRSRTAKRLGWPRYYGIMTCISLAGLMSCSVFIGMETVEIGYVVSLLGLCTVAHVHRVAQSEPAVELAVLPELEQVPPPDGEELAPA